jgi:transcriptional regulator with XRE-family HTH domain
MSELPIAPAGVDEEIGARVHSALWRARVQQKDLAAALGLDQGSLSKRLRGRIAWKVSELVVASTVLGVSVVDLLPETAVTAARPLPERRELGASTALSREDVPAEFR